MEKETIEEINRINSFLSGLNNVVDINTVHLAIVKISFKLLKANGKMSETLDAPAKLAAINDVVDRVTEDIILDRERIKNFFLKKIDHHYSIDVAELYHIANLNSMSADYGEINKELDLSSVIVPLVSYLRKVL